MKFRTIITYGVIVLLVLALGFFLGNNIKEGSQTTSSIPDSSIIHDTVRIESKPETIRVLATKIIYRAPAVQGAGKLGVSQDSLINSPPDPCGPYTAIHDTTIERRINLRHHDRVDTLVFKDTVYQAFNHPEHVFELAFASDPVAFAIPDTVVITKTEEKLVPRAWWIDPAIGVAGAVIIAASRALLKI